MSTAHILLISLLHNPFRDCFVESFFCIVSATLFVLFVLLVARVNRKFGASMTKCNQVCLLVTFIENDSEVSISLRSMTFERSSARQNRKQSGELSRTVVDLMKWRFYTYPSSTYQCIATATRLRCCHQISSHLFYVICLVCAIPPHSWKLLKSGCKRCGLCRTSR